MKTIVAFGDSITAPRGPLRVYASILQDALAGWEIDGQVINAGIGGHTTEDGRRRFETDVLAHQPDTVIIFFGANDAAVDVYMEPPATMPRVSRAEYEANLRFFCRSLAERGCRVILVTPVPFRWTEPMKAMYGKPPYDPNAADGFDLLLRAYAESVRIIACEECVFLADARAAFESYGCAPGHSIDELFLDGMHPNAAGQQLIAEVLLPFAGQLPSMSK